MVFIMGPYTPNSFVVLYGVIMVHMDSVYCMEVPYGQKSEKTWWKHGRSLDSQPSMVVPLKMRVNTVLPPILNNPAVNENLLFIYIYIYIHNTKFRFNHVFFAWIFHIFWAVPGSTSKTLRAFAHSSIHPVDTVDVRARGRHRRPLTWIEWCGLNHGLFPLNPFKKWLVVVGRIHIQTWMLDIFCKTKWSGTD